MTIKRDLLRGRRVLVTGASGFVGKNLVPLLEMRGASLICPSRSDYDLSDQAAVRRLLTDVRPEVVFNLAGVVGGILVNKRFPADYSYPNLLIGGLVLHEAWASGVSKYVTLIGGCSYPSRAPSPIAEERLWDGSPQSESAPYALAKRMSVVLAQAYRQQHKFDAVVLVPGNVYGPHDNFDLEASHVIPALIRKFCEARDRGLGEVVVWGTGRPVRDFIYIEDACAAILRATEVYSGPDIINISSGKPVAIRELVEAIAALTGFTGRIRWDTDKPDGQMEKVFDVQRMKAWIGFECETPLREGLRKTLSWFEANRDKARLRVGA